MSNFTDFFPIATAGGGGEITDPDKINKITTTTNDGSYLSNLFYTVTESGLAAVDSGNAFSPYFGPNTSSGNYGGGIVTQSANNTEITLANVTSGSGYLCCIVTPCGALGTTQEIKITVDGGTEKVYTIDYSVNTTVDNFYTRLIWGFAAWGNSEVYNLGNDNSNAGLTGLAGAPYTFNEYTYPPLLLNSSTSYVRLFTAPSFKNYGLPKLRFNSSILVKCKTTTLQNAGGTDYRSKATAVYYLDSQL
tara:strand:- start:15 stop:758 length:744 start_codon:yes stop_codon:yes gene_type:complete